MAFLRSFLAVILSLVMSSSSLLSALAQESGMSVLSFLALQTGGRTIEATVAGSELRADMVSLSLEGCSPFVLNPAFSADFQLSYSCEMSESVISGKYPVILKNTASNQVLFQQLVSYTAPISSAGEKLPNEEAPESSQESGEKSLVELPVTEKSSEGEEPTQKISKDPVKVEKKAKKKVQEQRVSSAETTESVLSTAPVEKPELQQQVSQKPPEKPKSPIPPQPSIKKQSSLENSRPVAMLAFQETSFQALQKALAMKRIPTRKESVEHLMRFAFPSSSSQPKVVLAMAPAMPALPIIGEGAATGATWLYGAILSVLSGAAIYLSSLFSDDEAIPQEQSEATTADPSNGCKPTGASDPYQIAKNGGKHFKTYKDYKDKPTKEIEKSLKSFEKNIELHQDKLKDPLQYIEDPVEREEFVNNENKKKGVIDHWCKEIQTFAEEAEIMKGILKERF